MERATRDQRHIVAARNLLNRAIMLADFAEEVDEEGSAALDRLMRQAINEAMDHLHQVTGSPTTCRDATTEEPMREFD